VFSGKAGTITTSWRSIRVGAASCRDVSCGSGFPAAMIDAGSISDTPEGSRCVNRSESVLSVKDGAWEAQPSSSICFLRKKHPSSRRSKFDSLQAQEFHHRVEIPVVVQQGQPVLDAESPDHDVDGLSHRNTPFS
jgi:hypothetical protein